MYYVTHAESATLAEVERLMLASVLSVPNNAQPPQQAQLISAGHTVQI
jgi:hypothetical protein